MWIITGHHQKQLHHPFSSFATTKKLSKTASISTVAINSWNPNANRSKEIIEAGLKLTRISGGFCNQVGFDQFHGKEVVDTKQMVVGGPMAKDFVGGSCSGYKALYSCSNQEA